MLFPIAWLDRQKFRLVAFFLPLCVYLIGLNGVWSADYPVSVLGMQYAMWSRHSFSLGTNESLLVQSVDLSNYAGNYYSAISPGFAILSFPFAALGFTLDGNTLNVFGSALILDEAFVAISSAVATLVVYEIARIYASNRSSLVAALALTFASPLWPASTVLFIHGVSLMFSTLSIYCILRYARGRGGVGNLLASGIFLGLAGFVEYVALLFVVPFALYAARRRTPRAVLVFLAGFAVGPLAQMAYNYVAFQNPLLFPEQFKTAATGSLLSRFDPYGILVHSSFYLVSPYRGIIFFSPIAILGIFALMRLAEEKVSRRDGFLFMSIFVITLVTYSSWTDWAGGLFYGPRFLILGLPSLMIPLAVLLDWKSSKKLGLLVLTLFGISSFVEGVGALTTAFGAAGGPSTFELAELNLPWLLQGRLDAWWISGGGLPSLVAGEILPAATFAVLWSTAAYILLRMRHPIHERWLASFLPKIPLEGKTKTIGGAPAESKT